MSHLSRDPKKLLNRIKRIKGQLESVERALDVNTDCTTVLQQLAAARGAINGLMAEVIEDHIRHHVASADIATQDKRDKGADTLVDVVRAYLK
jgi:DNA-binding FrmR family transcriptional regulator